MFRLFVISTNLFIAIVLKVFFADDIGVTLNVPNEVVAGTEFEVQVSIKKGELESYSRLLQTMPAGLTVLASESNNADFNFESKRARFIWMRMPDEEQFDVKYKIKVDPRLKGEFNIGGKFSYILDNERRTITVESTNITILPSPEIDPALIVDIADYERLVIPYIPTDNANAQIACVRQAPELTEDGKSYIVTLLVSKERKEKFAKIEEVVPSGYKAVAVNEGDAIFTYKNKTAKFLWMNLPASSLFTVSYKLVPTVGKKDSPELHGKFSYLEEAKTLSINIQQTNQDVALIKTTDELNQLIADIGSAPLADNDVAKNIEIPKEKQPRSNAKYVLEPEEGIYYRVQLAAGHSPVNVRRYFRQYKLKKEVRHEFHDGWYKYSVGSFPQYKNARDYREHIWNTTSIDDAFVSAYNDGSRITVQEALMISNQQWYK